MKYSFNADNGRIIGDFYSDSSHEVIRKKGIDHLLWNIELPTDSVFPEREKSKFDWLIAWALKNMKLSSESPRDYITRMSEYDKRSDDSHLFLVQGDVALKFGYEKKDIQQFETTLRFVVRDELGDPVCFAGGNIHDVPLRVHQTDMKYLGSIQTSRFDLPANGSSSQIRFSTPDQIRYGNLMR